jgi:predicted nucleic acid-binding protein
MRVFIDTNIFIDILLDRENFIKESKQIYKLCENSIIKGYIAPITINNIYYICRKTLNKDKLISFLCDISYFFTISKMNNKSVVFAKNLDINDFEDALQSAMAIQNNCHYIITRNTKDYKKIIGIKAIEPKEFLNRFF